MALLHVVWHEGLADDDYLAQRVNGASESRAAVASWWPERAERVSGVPATLLRDAARLLASAARQQLGPGAYVLTGRGAEQHAHGTDTVTAAINLSLALGAARPDRERLRVHHRPGQRAGRTGARARRPTSCPATGASATPPRERTWRRCGASTLTSCPAPGVPAIELHRPPRHRRRPTGAAGARRQPRWSPRLTPARA